MGEFTAGDNLNVTQVSDQVILGRNAKTLTTADTDSEVIIASRGGDLKTNLHILTEWQGNDTVGLNIETNASANTTTFRPDKNGKLYFATKDGVASGSPSLFTVDSANQWVGALALDLGEDGGPQDTALTVNNKNLIILNDGSTSQSSIGQYSPETFGIASNLTFDGSGLTKTQTDTSHGHAFINLETNTASGVIQFGVGSPNTFVTPQDYVMSIMQNSFYSQVIIEPSASIALGENLISSDSSSSSLKTLAGNNITYNNSNFNTAAIDDLTVNTDTFKSSSNGTHIKGYVSIEGSDDTSSLDLTKSGSGAALIYDSGSSNVQLSQTIQTQVSGVATSNIENTYLTAHLDSGYPQVDFVGITAVSGEIDSLVLNSELDVPGAIISELTANTASLATVTVDNLTSTDSRFEEKVQFDAVEIVYSSGTVFSQEVFTPTGYVTRDAYAVTVSGHTTPKYYIGAGHIGDASTGYPGVEIQQARPEPTIPTNFRIWDAYPTNNQNEISGYVHLR